MPHIIVDVFLQCNWTSLHRACQEGHTQVAELLLQAGASVEQETVVRWGASQDCVVVEQLTSQSSVDCTCI